MITAVWITLLGMAIIFAVLGVLMGLMVFLSRFPGMNAGNKGK